MEEDGGALPIEVGLAGARPSANKRGPWGGLKDVDEGDAVSASLTDMWLSVDNEARSSVGFVRSSNENTDKAGGAGDSVTAEGGALSLLLT